MGDGGSSSHPRNVVDDEMLLPSTNELPLIASTLAKFEDLNLE